MNEKPVMELDSVEIGVSRIKSLLHAAENILVGADSVEDEDLEALKNIIDMASECVRGVEDKLPRHVSSSEWSGEPGF